jgi:hypothetical protein
MELLITSLPQKECHHVPHLDPEPLTTRSGRRCCPFRPALSANASDRQDPVAVFPDVSTTAAADRAPIVLTSRLPWLAPGRQPHQADVPQHEAVSAWEQQQQQFDQELDRKLIICRGC